MHDADLPNAVAAAELESGSLLGELRPELEVVREVGRGSTVDVYLAREPARQWLVAVKVLRPELASDARVRQLFELQAQTSAQISHPHAAAVYRVGCLSNDLPYVVLEYVEGRTVAEIVAEQGAFAPAEARVLFASVAAALAAAHERGIVHGDVRPGNIYVETRTGRAVLGDCGIGAPLTSGAELPVLLTPGGVRLGDARYMSPEQLSGSPVTEQSDIYSFGLLAYEVLTGRGPYEASTDAQLMIAHMTVEPTPLRTLLPDAGVMWLPVVDRCLSKDPNRRPRSRELAAALAAPTGTMLAAAAPARGTLWHFLDEVRRRRVFRVLTGYAVFALVVLGVTRMIYDAFETVTTGLYRLMVALTLAGFPIALVLSWLYDLSPTGIQRTRSAPLTWRSRILKWAGLALSLAFATLVAWLLLGST
jgi:hypothetical protein